MDDITARIKGIFNSYHSLELLEDKKWHGQQGKSWRRVRLQMQSHKQRTDGLCLNVLYCNARYLRPFPINFSPDSIADLRQNTNMQTAVAHAYWQTKWAQMSIRETRGETAPLAMLALNRWESAQVGADVYKIEAGHAVIGTENYLLHLLHHDATGSAYRIGHDGSTFNGDAPAELLQWLNRVGFVDRFVGQNQGSGPINDIKNFVPFSGCHRISLMLPDSFSDYDLPPEYHPAVGDWFGAVNGGFFLNFPEEYRHKWCAMNDITGVLVVNGRILQLPLVKRGAIIVDRAGRARIEILSMADIRMKMPGENDYFSPAIDSPEDAGRCIVAFTPSVYRHGKSGDCRTPAGAVVDVCVVFRRIVEVKRGGGTEIPPNGFVLSLPEKRYGFEALLETIQTHGEMLSFAFSSAFDGVETAFGAGPIVFEDGVTITENFFQQPADEEFSPAVFKGDSVIQSGLIPTRFPHDTISTRAPRTVIGTTKTGDLCIVVIDGRDTAHSIGATLQEAGSIAALFGSTKALNLDGGGSSALFINSQFCNAAAISESENPFLASIPSDHGKLDRLMPVPIFISQE